MTLELHHLHLAQSERIVWLLEEMKVPYKLVVHQRDPKTGLSPEPLKKVVRHPPESCLVD
jgi:glutathione S-transferase